MKLELDDHRERIYGKFYRELDEFEEKFRNNGKRWLTEKLKNLDIDLMNGKVSAEKYREQKAEVELTLKWFMVQS